VTSTKKYLSGWNRNRKGQVELDSVARIFLADAEVTDRDRIAFALRDLRKRGYDAEASPVDWTKERMICSLDDSIWDSFGKLTSELSDRLYRIAQRANLMTERNFNSLFTELQPDEDLFEELYPDEHLSEQSDFLERPYEFTFRGDPVLINGVFQSVGFSTRHGLCVLDDGSRAHYFIEVAPPNVVDEE